LQEQAGGEQARRIAANRCSRRAAASRVAVLMNMTTGNSNASAATARITSSVLALPPAPAKVAAPAVAMLSTLADPGTRASCGGVCPMTMISESGDGSAAGPIMPACQGHLDILHANAGVLIAGTALSQTINDWDNTYAVNVKGTFLSVRAVLPHMQHQNSGVIIITASVSGMIGEPSLVAYNSSKGALINLTRQLAVEYAKDQIRVNCICPGWIDTGFNDPVLGHLTASQLEQFVMQEVPLGRQGTPEDIAPSVVFLASDDAAYITGQSLVIDGGLTSR
jgi:NAD(P)-dependent dehydrogenase (short-subunit alcohol dehydrogenase family)